MQKTKIEWVKNLDGTQGYSWNPIKGICPVGCWYCYARKIYDRFLSKKYYDPETAFLDTRETWAPYDLKKPSGIFVCSTFELFHPSVKWTTDNIFRSIEENPQHRFYILTKFPQNIDRPMPDNVWLGVTIDVEKRSFEKIKYLVRAKAKIKFISYEPLLEYPMIYGFEDNELLDINWIIVGRLTQHGKKYDPPKWWIDKIVKIARAYKIPPFLKDNLKDIYGKPLIQEIPENV
jgi:protein gp37